MSGAISSKNWKRPPTSSPSTPADTSGRNCPPGTWPGSFAAARPATSPPLAAGFSPRSAPGSRLRSNSSGSQTMRRPAPTPRASAARPANRPRRSAGPRRPCLPGASSSNRRCSTSGSSPTFATPPPPGAMRPPSPPRARSTAPIPRPRHGPRSPTTFAPAGRFASSPSIRSAKTKTSTTPTPAAGNCRSRWRWRRRAAGSMPRPCSDTRGDSSSTWPPCSSTRQPWAFHTAPTPSAGDFIPACRRLPPAAPSPRLARPSAAAPPPTPTSPSGGWSQVSGSAPRSS